MAFWARMAARSNTGWAYSYSPITVAGSMARCGLSETITGVFSGSGCSRLIR